MKLVQMATNLPHNDLQLILIQGPLLRVLQRNRMRGNHRVMN